MLTSGWQSNPELQDLIPAQALNGFRVWRLARSAIRSRRIANLWHGPPRRVSRTTLGGNGHDDPVVKVRGLRWWGAALLLVALLAYLVVGIRYTVLYPSDHFLGFAIPRYGDPDSVVATAVVLGSVAWCSWRLWRYLWRPPIGDDAAATSGGRSGLAPP